MKLPQSFLDLHAAGRFDYWGGKRYHDMEDADRARLLAERRTEVLWLRNIEWDVPLEEVAELDWTRPGLYGFAGNGGGDAYAFYPAWQADAAEPPVILVAHDEMVASVFAPTFALALYRLWLENGVYWDVGYDGDDRESALRAWAGILAPFLDAGTRATLEALAVELVPAQLRAALDTFVASLPTTQLATNLPPTRYNSAYVKGEVAKRMYAQSIAFFDALVKEGHEGFRRHADEARANRDAALALEERATRLRAIVSKPKPEKATAPKAKPVKKAAPKKAAKAKPAKKAAPKKSSLKPAAPKKAKKAAPKKAAPKKAAPKKAKPAAPKKAKPAAPKKAKPAAPKKAKPAAPKKAAVKKAAPKKAAVKKAAKKTAPKKPKTATPKKAAKKRAPKKAKKAPSRKARR